MWRVALAANTLRRGAYARNNVVSLQSKGQCYGGPPEGPGDPPPEPLKRLQPKTFTNRRFGSTTAVLVAHLTRPQYLG
jgi:hypothetical protein